MPFQLPPFAHRVFRYRSTRITSEGLQFLIFTLAIGIAAINTGNNLFYLLLSMMLSLILVSGIAAEYCLRRLELRRHVPDLLFLNTPVTSVLAIKNLKPRLTSFSLTLCDVSADQTIFPNVEIHSLPPGASRLLSYPLTPTRRGRWRLSGIRISTEFPFGLFTKRAFYPMEDTLVVCPEIRPIYEGLLRGLFAAGYEQTVHRRGHGSDLYNLRLYQAGDDSRSIHWPTTARTSQLTIRETEAEAQRRAIIHVPTSVPASHDAPFERAVSLAASLVQHLIHHGYSIQLRVGSDRSSFGQGEAHRLELLRMLALCQRDAPREESMRQDEWPDGHSDLEGDGTAIVVQAWCDSGDGKTEFPRVLIDGELIPGAAHAT
ncbi:MAG: DUF58 domain-containing protein [Nitrospira sp.]|nr:DUF58 domain-containing protein [Nitrospira sp.]MDH4303300.1 DUF58 domain-containing protein [Nitrospira sp.]MDH5193287.1 DUF58 domain-containing protein [Nitrospira sp.]